jgi:hypothetical protein
MGCQCTSMNRPLILSVIISQNYRNITWGRECKYQSIPPPFLRGGGRTFRVFGPWIQGILSAQAMHFLLHLTVYVCVQSSKLYL